MDLAFTRRCNARSIVYVKADVCNCELPPPKKKTYSVRGVRCLDCLSLRWFVRPSALYVFLVFLCFLLSGSALSCGRRCRASNGGAACLPAVFVLKGFLTSQLRRKKKQKKKHSLAHTHTHKVSLFFLRAKTHTGSWLAE